MSKTENNKKLSLDARIKQLEADTEWFYGDDFTIDEAIKKYQSAARLASEIDQDLTKLKNQVEILADFSKKQ